MPEVKVGWGSRVAVYSVCREVDTQNHAMVHTFSMSSK